MGGSSTPIGGRLIREAVEDFDGEGVSKAGGISAAALIEIEGVKDVTVPGVDPITAEQSGVQPIPSARGGKADSVVQTKSLYDPLADGIESRAREVVVPIVIAEHVVQAHPHWNPV